MSNQPPPRFPTRFPVASPEEVAKKQARIEKVVEGDKRYSTPKKFRVENQPSAAQHVPGPFLVASPEEVAKKKEKIETRVRDQTIYHGEIASSKPYQPWNIHHSDYFGGLKSLQKEGAEPPAEWRGAPEHASRVLRNHEAEREKKLREAKEREEAQEAEARDAVIQPAAPLPLLQKLKIAGDWVAPTDQWTERPRLRSDRAGSLWTQPAMSIPRGSDTTSSDSGFGQTQHGLTEKTSIHVTDHFLQPLTLDSETARKLAEMAQYSSDPNCTEVAFSDQQLSFVYLTPIFTLLKSVDYMQLAPTGRYSSLLPKLSSLFRLMHKEVLSVLVVTILEKESKVLTNTITHLLMPELPRLILQAKENCILVETGEVITVRALSGGQSFHSIPDFTARKLFKALLASKELSRDLKVNIAFMMLKWYWASIVLADIHMIDLWTVWTMLGDTDNSITMIQYLLQELKVGLVKQALPKTESGSKLMDVVRWFFNVFEANQQKSKVMDCCASFIKPIATGMYEIGLLTCLRLDYLGMMFSERLWTELLDTSSFLMMFKILFGCMDGKMVQPLTQVLDLAKGRNFFRIVMQRFRKYKSEGDLGSVHVFFDYIEQNSREQEQNRPVQNAIRLMGSTGVHHDVMLSIVDLIELGPIATRGQQQRAKMTSYQRTRLIAIAAAFLRGFSERSESSPALKATQRIVDSIHTSLIQGVYATQGKW